VRPCVLQAEEVSEAHHQHPPNNQNNPQDSWYALLGHDQARPPCVRKPLDLVEPFCVELLLSPGAWLIALEGCPDVVDENPRT
jgi:hypothetical protein